MLERDYEPGFYVKHFVKDMAIALEEAEDLGVSTPALKYAKSLYDKLMEEDNQYLGIQALFSLYM